VIGAGGRDTSEAQLGLPSEAEEVFGSLTASMAHWYQEGACYNFVIPPMSKES